MNDVPLAALKPQTENQVMNLIRDYLDVGDRWGTALLAWFDICEALTAVEFPVPTDWRYRPGAVQDRKPPASVLAGEIIRDIETQMTAADEWVNVGRVLKRYVEACERAGLSY